MLSVSKITLSVLAVTLSIITETPSIMTETLSVFERNSYDIIFFHKAGKQKIVRSLQEAKKNFCPTPSGSFNP